MSLTISTLSDLVEPEALAPFLASFAAKRCWHRPAARATVSQSLLPWAAIESLVAHSLIPLNRFRVVVNAHELPPAMYSDAKGNLRPDAVQGFASQGATLVITDIGALVSTIGELTASMERDLRCNINVNCYITFGEASAFLNHHDGHDVLILQIHGTKHWRRFGSPVAFPIGGGNATGKLEPVWEALLAPGDLLYLPRGEIHGRTLAVPI